MKNHIYFDYAATTPLNASVLASMLPYLQENYGNASSVHTFGKRAAAGLESSREQVSNFLSCSFNEVVFTSGATESNNIILQGMLSKGDHLIISTIEHPSVMEVAKLLESKGVLVSYISVNKDGIIDLDKLFSAVTTKTKLISIMYVNNEVGTIQPIKMIGKRLLDLNKDRNNNQKIYFHTDAVQAVPYIGCNVTDLGVDFLSFSGHKIYGPKGIGALYIKKGIKLRSIMFGGGQEMGISPGTENVAGIVGLGAATKYILEQQQQASKLKVYRDLIISSLKKANIKFIINGSLDSRIVANINISVFGVEGESMVYRLDMEGISVSSASACSSHIIKPSIVVEAMGGRQRAGSTLRISLGYTTTKVEVDQLISILIPTLSEMQINK